MSARGVFVQRQCDTAVLKLWFSPRKLLLMKKLSLTLLIKGKWLLISNKNEYSKLVAVSERYEGLIAKRVSENTISNQSVCNTRLHDCSNTIYKVKCGYVNKVMLVHCLQSN